MKRVSPYVVGAACGVALTAALSIVIVNQPVNRPPIAKPLLETVTDGNICVSTAIDTFKLTPAPQFETVLQKWKRTKADYEKQSKAVRELAQLVESQDMPAWEAHQDAEKELQTAQCGKVCVVEKTR